MLTLEQQGMLVCHALNCLPYKQDMYEGVTDFGCCPLCCAPCSLLADLYQAGRLTQVVRQAPSHLWGDNISWWVDGGVDPEHLDAAWFHRPCPLHEDDPPDE